MADVAAVCQQLQEFNNATVVYSDWELAYKMQLEEAMAASALNVDLFEVDGAPEEFLVGKRSCKTGLLESSTPVLSPVTDLPSVLQFQSGELLKLEQELKDQHQAKEDAQGLVLEMRRRHHDMEFARSVDEMSDEEWERVGDYYEKPFHKIDEDDWDSDQICNLCTARAREEPGYMAMAWSVTDAEGRILIEQSKYLGLEVAAYVADYTALLEGLTIAVAAGVKNIHVCCNSPTVYNQMVGQWTARAPKQVKFYEQVLEQREQLEQFSIELVPKDKNVHAINLAHEAIRKHIELTLKKGAEKQEASSSGQASPAGEKAKMGECPICLERVRETDTFEVRGCFHRFCVSCLTQHVQIRVKSNQVPVKCPQSCSNSVDIDQCRGILSPELLESYAVGLTEASIPESERVYSPFPSCSSLMSKSDLTPSVKPSTSRQIKVAAVFERAECMECHRLFCVECRVPWHANMSCEEYQSLPPQERDAEDIKLYTLASNNKWQRCKKCRRMIELDQGCYHMTCRCGHEFCYICGAPWINKQATCKCKLWDEQHIVGDPFPSDESETDSEIDSEFGDTEQLFPNPFPRQPMPRTYKTRICRFWSSGYCRAGALCTFAHGPEELRFML